MKGGENMKIFDEFQEEQINLAKNNYSDAVYILERHPEWSSTLMNVVWNRLKNYKGNTEDDINYDGILEFAKLIPTKDGKYGDYGLLLTYIAACEQLSPIHIDLGNSMFDYVEIQNERGSSISANELLWYAIKTSNAPNNTRQKLTGVFAERTDFMTALLSEGNEDAKHIIEDILYHSQTVDKIGAEPFDRSGLFLGSHMQLGMNNLLALDDMNIRGEQILYAFDYCDRDLKTLSTMLRTRDKDMIAYVNQRAVEEGIKNNKIEVPKAVAAQASFDFFRNHSGVLTISEFDFDMYKDKSKKLVIDWKTREIISGTSVEDAIKILKANGFEMAYNEPVDYVNKRERSIHQFNSDVPNRCIIMQNPKTGAVFQAPLAQEDDICYGGAEIVMATNNKLDWTNANFKHQSNYIDNSKETYGKELFGHKITYHDGTMIKEYQEVVNDDNLEPDSSRIGCLTMENIEIPEKTKYEAAEFNAVWYEYKNKKLMPYFCGIGHKVDAFHINRAAAAISLEETIKNMSEDKKSMFKPFLDDKYSNTLKYIYFTNDLRDNSIVMGLTFRMLDTPIAEREKYYEAAMEIYNERINNIKSRIKKEGLSCPKWLKNNLKIEKREASVLEKNKDIFLGNDKIIDMIFDEFPFLYNEEKENCEIDYNFSPEEELEMDL